MTRFPVQETHRTGRLLGMRIALCLALVATAAAHPDHGTPSDSSASTSKAEVIGHGDFRYRVNRDLGGRARRRRAACEKWKQAQTE